MIQYKGENLRRARLFLPYLLRMEKQGFPVDSIDVLACPDENGKPFLRSVDELFFLEEDDLVEFSPHGTYPNGQTQYLAASTVGVAVWLEIDNGVGYSREFLRDSLLEILEKNDDEVSNHSLSAALPKHSRDLRLVGEKELNSAVEGLVAEGLVAWNVQRARNTIQQFYAQITGNGRTYLAERPRVEWSQNMVTTLKRRILQFIQEKTDPDRIIEKMKEAGHDVDPVDLKKAILELVRERVFEWHPFDNVDPTHFVVWPGERYHEALEQTPTNRTVAHEILELLYRNEVSTGCAYMMFEAIKKAFGDLSETKLKDASRLLAEHQAVNLRGANGGIILRLILERRGREIVEGESSLAESSTISVSYGHTINATSSNVMLNSPGAQQNLTIGEQPDSDAYRTALKQVLAALDEAREHLDAAKAANFEAHLNSALVAVDDDDPDLEYANSSIKQALKKADSMVDSATETVEGVAEVVDSVTKLGTALILLKSLLGIGE